VPAAAINDHLGLTADRDEVASVAGMRIGHPLIRVGTGTVELGLQFRHPLLQRQHLVA
jgi:hypothetical protein